MGNESGKGRKQKNDALLCQLPLGTIGDSSHGELWEPGKNTCSSELTHLNGNGAGILMFKLQSVMRLGCSQKGFHSLCFQPITLCYMDLTAREKAFRQRFVGASVGSCPYMHKAPVEAEMDPMGQHLLQGDG